MIPQKFVKYTIKEFRKDFATDDICLDYLFKQFYGHLNDFDKYYKIKGRKEYVHSVTGEHISPTANSIFHKSSTPLTTWFEVIYKFCNSRNGVSAMEIMRDFGMTYKCAWRVANQVRSLFGSSKTDKLAGIVEADETYIGGKEGNKKLSKRQKGTQGRSSKTKTPVIGVVKRTDEDSKSEIRAKVVTDTTRSTIMPFVKANVKINSSLMTDEYQSYNGAYSAGYDHQRVIHSSSQYVFGNVYTNTMEGFWSLLKCGITGTYRMVSPKYLQMYVNEFMYRYNHDHSKSHLFETVLCNLVRNDLVV